MTNLKNAQNSEQASKLKRNSTKYYATAADWIFSPERLTWLATLFVTEQTMQRSQPVRKEDNECSSNVIQLIQGK